MHSIRHKSLSPSIFYCLFASVLIIAVQSSPSRNKSHGNGRKQAQRVACQQNERYHKETEQCHPLNLQGPCGENMMFMEDTKNTEFGTCECQDHQGCQYWPFTYWEPENRCYPLFERGPCKENEWLVNHQQQNPRRHGRDRNSKHRNNQDAEEAKTIHGECKRRECPPMPQKMFIHKGNCYETETQGFCSTNQEKMYFTKGCAEPRCFNTPVKAPVCATQNLGGGTIQRIIIATPVPPKSSTAIPFQPLLPTPKPVMPPPEDPMAPQYDLSKNSTRTLSKARIRCQPNERPNSDGGCEAGASI